MRTSMAVICFVIFGNIESRLKFGGRKSKCLFSSPSGDTKLIGFNPRSNHARRPARGRCYDGKQGKANNVRRGSPKADGSRDCGYIKSGLVWLTFQKPGHREAPSPAGADRLETCRQ
jgi:hypothetical protein